jgi:hypothetical protein
VKQIRQRLTYANVMSSIAVFFILGGATAFAATKIGANELKANSVLTGKIVKEAVTTSKIKNSAVNTSKLGAGAVTSDKLADNAVTTTKIADKAVTAAKINVTGLPAVPNAVNATNATNAAALGGKPASEYPIRYFARVNGTAANPTLAAGSPGMSVDPTRPFNPGAARVTFPVDMTDCAVVVTGVSGGATVVTRQSTTSSGNNVVVATESDAGASINASFNIIGIC